MAWPSHPARAVAALALVLACTTARAEAEWIYAVKPGDTLIDVAAAYLAVPSKWPRLQALNGVAEPRHLQPGTKLRIPVALLKQEAAVAEVIFLRGAATVTTAGGSSRSLTSGDRLAIGDSVATGAGATLTLRFVDGSRLLLAPNTQVALVQMIAYGATGMAQTIVDLQHGSVDSRVAAQQEPAARYEIKSRALNLMVRGTEYRAHVDPASQQAHSEVLSGKVRAQGERGKPIVLAPGFGTFAAAGAAAAPPKRLIAAPDLSGLPARTERLPLSFQWPALPDARSYRAQIFAAASPDQLLLDDSFARPNAKWADLPDGRYVLRARAIDSSGLEGLDADREFVLKARPEPPFLNAPLDGQKVYGPEAVFRWTSNPSSTYHLQLADRADFSHLLAEERDLSTPEHRIVLAPGSYYWRIATIVNGDDQGPFSDTQGFVQRPIPQSPSLETPTLDDEQFTFRWRAGPPGSRYQLQVARAQDFSEPVLDQTVEATQASLNRPEPGTYYLRIKTIDADGFAGPFGPTQELEVPAKTPWWLLILLAPLAL